MAGAWRQQEDRVAMAEQQPTPAMLRLPILFRRRYFEFKMVGTSARRPSSPRRCRAVEVGLWAWVVAMNAVSSSATTEARSDAKSDAHQPRRLDSHGEVAVIICVCLYILLTTAAWFAFVIMYKKRYGETSKGSDQKPTASKSAPVQANPKADAKDAAPKADLNVKAEATKMSSETKPVILEVSIASEHSDIQLDVGEGEAKCAGLPPTIERKGPAWGRGEYAVISREGNKGASQKQDNGGLWEAVEETPQAEASRNGSRSGCPPSWCAGSSIVIVK